MSDLGRIGAATVLRMLGRSLFVQASWSFERLQAPGFFLTLLPALRRAAPGAEGVEAAALRHLARFNTHPYFAGLVAATVARVEAGGAGGGETAAALKHSLMSALGGIGDDLFWARLRPAAALGALVLALAGSSWAVAAFLLAYNVPHLGARLWGIRAGFRSGRAVAGALQAPLLHRCVSGLGVALPALAGLLLGAIAVAPRWRPPLPGAGAAAAAAALLFAATLAVEGRGVRAGAVLGAAAAAALLAGLAGEALAP